MSNITASFEFSGMSDYWHGMGSRGEGHGAAFAYYGRNTTLRDLVDQWVEDIWTNDYDFADLPESVTCGDIRAAILESFTNKGRAGYESDAVCEFSTDWVSDNPQCCRECGAEFGDCHEYDCCINVVFMSEYPDEEVCEVLDDDCEDCDDDMESPVAIIEIGWHCHPDYVVCDDLLSYS